MAFAVLSGLPAIAHARGATAAERMATQLGELLSGEQPLLAVAVAWLGGLLTAFTPCVYPLYPITLRYFGGGSTYRSSRRVFGYALTYVSGMTLLYAALGTAFAAMGVVFGRALGSPWVTGTMALVTFAMAVSLLGAFTIQLPSAVTTRLGMVGDHTHRGAFMMGAVSGLIAAPCTGPVLAVILTLIARSGAVGLGFALMVAFGFGVGAPLLVIAGFSHRLAKLPKSGPWMTGIEVVLASAMMLVAVYFAALASKRIDAAVGALPSVVAVIAAVVGMGFLVALLVKRIGEGLGQSVAVAGLSLALVTLVLGGERGPQSIAWSHVHDEGVQRALAAGKAVMIDFTADWCTGCKELDAHTFPDPRVSAEAERFVALKLDATTPDAAMNALFQRYGIYGLPTIVFIDPRGRVLETPRVTGFTPPERFVDLMQQVR